MLAEAERRIAAAGLPMCRLDCRAGNARLRRYYAAAGYTERGERVPRNAAQPGIYTVTLLEKDLMGPPEKGLENGTRDA
jgi:protein-tyrosine phosphatase